MVSLSSTRERQRHRKQCGFFFYKEVLEEYSEERVLKQNHTHGGVSEWNLGGTSRETELGKTVKISDDSEL